MIALEFLKELRDKYKCIPLSQRTRPFKEVSNSELRQWIIEGAVLFNGETMLWNEELDFNLFSLVFFPNSNSRTTIL